ncbi:hypothetical protein HK097_009931 [Rhizophlyctis rosea]|uniref:Coiled-coil domain-containing protein n=1 Tax=Rhizophlyctis rosea TaxID=64517 RepID=A0AAD5SK62_9FUNG|nr:hypothetical protein HK097_009931 [Rhizophlyctis rosea]
MEEYSAFHTSNFAKATPVEPDPLENKLAVVNNKDDTSSYSSSFVSISAFDAKVEISYEGNNNITSTESAPQNAALESAAGVENNAEPTPKETIHSPGNDPSRAITPTSPHDFPLTINDLSLCSVPLQQPSASLKSAHHSISSPSAPSPHVNASIPSPTVPLRTAIQTYCDIDMHKGEEAFRCWVEGKRSASRQSTHRGSPRIDRMTHEPIPYLTRIHNSRNGESEPILIYQSSNRPPPSPHLTTSTHHALNKTYLSPKDLSQQRKERNESAFRAWLSRKNEQSHILSIHRSTETSRRLAKQVEEDEKRLKHSEKVRKELKEWARGKREKEKEERMERENKERERYLLERARKAKGDAAFKDWVRNVRWRGEGTDREAQWVPKQAWVDVVPKQEADSVGQSKILGSKMKTPRKAGVLSPPHLYREYELYERLAPEYLRKYRILVASGGMGMHHVSKETNINKCHGRKRPA